MPSSYNGWPASRTPSVIGVNQSWEPIRGHDFPGGTKSGDVQVIFTYLVRQLHARVESIVIYPPGDEWGYAYRDNVNNPGQLSCHASATAIDYNATEHPNKIKYTWTRAQTRVIHEILDELDGVVRWLEGYDEMHFEIRGTAAQVKAVATRLQRKGLFMHLTETEEKEILTHLRRLDPFPPENLSSTGKKVPVGTAGSKPASRLYRWTAETVEKIRTLHN